MFGSAVAQGQRGITSRGYNLSPCDERVNERYSCSHGPVDRLAVTRYSLNRPQVGGYSIPYSLGSTPESSSAPAPARRRIVRIVFVQPRRIAEARLERLPE